MCKAWLSMVLVAGGFLLWAQDGSAEQAARPRPRQVAEETRAQVQLLREQLEQALGRLEQLERLRGISHYRFPREVELLGVRIPLERRDLWERMDREFLLLVNDVPQVLLWLKRARRYFPLLEEKIRLRGLPQDLRYVAIVESSLRPEARSSAGAVGIWQFIQSTGALYQLEVNSWVDERLDPVRSTEAALSYLENLYREFGDWILALAAYNSGEDRVRREMDRQRVQSFYDLVLPPETERYVFRIASAKVILSDPEAYGFQLQPEELYEPFQAEAMELELDRHVDLIALALACGMTYRNLRILNPHLKESRLPKGRYRIYLPRGKATQVAGFLRSRGTSAAQKQSMPPRRETPQWARSSGREKILHKVQRNETLWEISQKYGVEVKWVQQWNQLGRSDRIRPGQHLVIYR